jgi:hypothetical protein
MDAIRFISWLWLMSGCRHRRPYVFERRKCEGLLLGPAQACICMIILMLRTLASICRLLLYLYKTVWLHFLLLYPISVPAQSLPYLFILGVVFHYSSPLYIRALKCKGQRGCDLGYFELSGRPLLALYSRMNPRNCRTDWRRTYFTFRVSDF